VRLATVTDRLESRDATPESCLLRAELYADLWHRVVALPGPYRRILAPRYEHDLSYAEIGQALSNPVSTVRMRLSRARRHLAGGSARDAAGTAVGDGAAG